jgi:glycosyltransferase involved in cell wall biosynthesis
MKRICHLTSVHPVFDIRIFHKECISLAKNGFEVTLIAPGQGLPYEKDGVNIFLVNIPVRRLKRMVFITFLMFFSARKTKAEVYHFHDPELMFCGVLLRLTGKKVIFDIHENVRLSFKTKEWVPKILRGLLAVLYFGAERFCLLFFNRLILAEDSYQKFYPIKKSTVVLNYPILKHYDHIDKENEKPLRLVYTGVVHVLKGVWEMLDLVKSLHQQGIKCQMLLVGEVRPERLLIEINEFLRENQLNDIVKLTGRVQFTEVAAFIQNSDIGLSLLKPIPNYYESLPTKIFEYMQFGLPVITNNFPLYKKYIEESGAGICVDISLRDELIGQVVKLLGDKTRIEELGQKGIFAVTTKYNWAMESRKLIKVYNNLLQ